MKNVTWIPEKIRIFLKKNGLLVGLGLVGVILLLLASGTSEKSTVSQDNTDFCKSYIEDLEGKLSKVVCEIAGVKDCSIMITLKSGVEYVYATDESANTDENVQGGDKKEQSEEKVTIVTDKQTGEKAVIVTERYPQINGVAIICQAPDSPTLTLALKNAASTALGIDPGNVGVLLKG